MRIDIISIFPDIIDSYIYESIIKNAQNKSLLSIVTHNLRDFTLDKHHKVDDRPYGGGPGMIMSVQPIYDCVQHVRKQNPEATVIYLSPKGKMLTHKRAEKLSKSKGLILLCGRYEGIDQRAIDLCVDQEISIGKYVLTGGELPALVVMDAVSRFLPGVLGDENSAHQDSFSPALGGKKEYPQYTKPREYMGRRVPDVLLNGNHAEIEKWRINNLS